MVFVCAGGIVLCVHVLYASLSTFIQVLHMFVFVFYPHSESFPINSSIGIVAQDRARAVFPSSLRHKYLETFLLSMNCT